MSRVILPREKHPAWKGGRVAHSNGYIAVRADNHPNGIKGGVGKYVLEHRLVMENHLGRYLRSDEVVHHINTIRSDNRIENLMLTTSGINVAISNHVRPVTESYRKKRSVNASKFTRNEKGRFIKSNSQTLLTLPLK